MVCARDLGRPRSFDADAVVAADLVLTVEDPAAVERLVHGAIGA